MNDIKDDPCLKSNKKKEDKIINAPKKNLFKKKIFFYKKIYKNRQETDKENSIQFLTKKTLRFKVDKRGDYKKRQLNDNDDTNEGRWTREEHDKFLDGIFKYGANWKKVKTLISTRTIIQVRSHAQKFYMKLKMCKDERLGIDFTSDNITSIKEMILLIKTKNKNYNIKNIFKYLYDEFDNHKKTTNKDSQNYISRLFENDFQKNNNNIGENNINCIFKNYLNINNNNKCNSYNNILNLLNIKQMNNIPLNNNILFNHNINNIFDCKNNLFLTNNLNNNNNNSYLNVPVITSILDKLMFLLVELFQSFFGKNILLLVLF